MLEENSLDSTYDATDPGEARFVYEKDVNAPSRATYAAVRNIAPYAESILAASETVSNGVKICVDSDRYLNIDKE